MDGASEPQELEDLVVERLSHGHFLHMLFEKRTDEPVIDMFERDDEIRCQEFYSVDEKEGPSAFFFLDPERYDLVKSM